MPKFDANHVFACPRCDRTPLAVSADALRCEGCKIDFPFVGGLPWLFAEPAAALDGWRSRLHFALQTLEHRGNELNSAANQPDLLESTLARLRSLATATAAHRSELSALLEPLSLSQLSADRVTHLALRTRLPPDQGLTTYYGNVHRDWAWGAEENAATADLIERRLGDRKPGRILILGCGAGRLAWDIATRFAPAHTTALDFNPLLVFVADRLCRGETLELHEFPVAPRDTKNAAIKHSLTAPQSAEIDFVIGDVHRPPFAAKSFDTIVTPWLVDIVPEPLEALSRRINQLLDDDGVWVNFGSLNFHHGDPALRYSPEECADAIAQCGFETPELNDDTIPYMQNPASRHSRRETVVSWAAEKKQHINRTARYEALPDWIVRGKDPVPLTDFSRTQAVSTRIHAHILSLIDGRRSIADMATVLEQQRLMPKSEAEPSIRQFMIRLFEDSQSGHRY